MAGTKEPTRRCRRHAVAGFTLTELMIAVVVLIAILLGTSKIFNTTSQVTGAGQATADIMQEVAAIERQLRGDFSRMAPDGIFAIRCVSVPNNIRGSGLLLNPNLPADARIRSDQMVYFLNGLQTAQTFKRGHGANHKGQGTSARVYFGHAFQLGDQAEAADLTAEAQGHDPAPVVFPWSFGDVGMVWTYYQSRSGQEDDDDIFDSRDGGTITVPPVNARRWLLVRHPVLLVDDDVDAPESNHKTTYLNQVLSARSLFLDDPRSELRSTPQLFHGRMDASAMQTGDLRSLLEYTPAPPTRRRPWRMPNLNPTDQMSMIAGAVPGDAGPMGLLYYPRAERQAPSMSRVDQAVTNAVLGVACSSIQIDWTYAEGVGEILDDDSVPEFAGFSIDDGERDRGQPWFGLWENPQDQSVGFVRPYEDELFWTPAETVFHENVERIDLDSRRFDRTDVYEAVFGLNQHDPYDQDGNVTDGNGYTPWPTAIRVTLRLHDPGTKLEYGREVQFVIDLPERVAIARP